MKKLVLWILAIFGILFLLLIGTVIAGVYYSKDIDKIKVEKFEITQFKSISKNSFNLTAKVYLNNPSRLSIPIKSIKYTIYLNETGEEIANGETPPFKIESGKVNIITINNKIKLDKVIKTLPKLILKDNVPATVKLNITIDYPIIRNKPIPFEFEIDVKEYLLQFAKEQIPFLDQIPIEQIEKIIPS